MKYLIDTHTLLWFINGDNSLSSSAKNILLNKENNCYISCVSLWEIAIKISLKKLEIVFSFEELEAFLLSNEIIVLPISTRHLNELLTLPFVHRDPFDRMIIAQCISEGMTCVSKDENIPLYNEIKVIW